MKDKLRYIFKEKTTKILNRLMILIGIISILYWSHSLSFLFNYDTFIGVFPILGRENILYIDCFLGLIFIILFLIYVFFVVLWTILWIFSRKSITPPKNFIRLIFLIILSPFFGHFIIMYPLAKISINRTLKRGEKIVCALEKFKDENGKYPEDLKELLPNYMKEFSKDELNSIFSHGIYTYELKCPFSKNIKNQPQFTLKVNRHGGVAEPYDTIYFPYGINSKGIRDEYGPFVKYKRENKNWITIYD